MRRITFLDSDNVLIAQIKEYQAAHGLPSFVAAVRKLCRDALEIEKNPPLSIMFLAQRRNNNEKMECSACDIDQCNTILCLRGSKQTACKSG